jgi:ring-1,2-phenylacetyl-CoA epoxidase subunit PaaE
MSVHFYRLKIGEIRKETPDCVSIQFIVPEELKETFRYAAGQHLTLRATINGEDQRRSYSICSSPLDGELRVAIKKVEGGVFSNYANRELKSGDHLEVMPPSGKFNSPLKADQKKQYLAIAAGSGITPILSLIKTTLATEPKSEFTLVYGNRNRGSIIFFEALEALKNLYMNRFSVMHVLSREKTESPLQVGRINAEKLEAMSQLIHFAQVDEVFLCGPQEMIETATEFLQQQGLDKKKIHLELFTSATKKTVSQKVASENNATAKSKVGIRVDGRQLEIEMSLQEDQTILDAALQQGADLPFACKGGMCCTCKAKLIEGEVMMDVHWGLEEEEVEQGFILTCQSHPKTERIVVDFDVK